MYSRISFPCQLFAICFLLSTLLPLVRVSEERVALFIVVSKTFGSLVKLHFELAIALKDILNGPAAQSRPTTMDLPHWYMSLYVGYTQIMVVSLYGHILALALNRFVGIYFPFAYKFWMSKGRIFACCSAIWAFSASFGLLYLFLDDHQSLQLIACYSLACLSATIGLYLLISMKLLARKYLHRTSDGNNNNPRVVERQEKNPVKISLSCFGSLIFGLVYLTLPLFQSEMSRWPNNTRFLFETLMIVVYDCIYCSDELFLSIAPLEANSNAHNGTNNNMNGGVNAEEGNSRRRISAEEIEDGNSRRRISAEEIAKRAHQQQQDTQNENRRRQQKQTLLVVALLFAGISLASYLTFSAAWLTRVLPQPQPACTGTIEGYPCLLNTGAGCPPNGTYWSKCDMFMPWLSGKELGCRRRVYTAASSCFSLWQIQYGVKYLCCPDETV